MSLLFRYRTSERGWRVERRTQVLSGVREGLPVSTSESREKSYHVINLLIYDRTPNEIMCVCVFV